MKNRGLAFILKAIHKMYCVFSGDEKWPEPDILDVDEGSQAIYSLLSKGTPCMVARFGSTELLATLNAMAVQKSHSRPLFRSIIQYIGNKLPQFWWNEKAIMQMQTNAGFFPPTHENIMRFAELMTKDMPLLDILGSWQASERYVLPYIKDALRIRLLEIEPFFAKLPWTRSLKGKKVLVIHPFAPLIEKQYLVRNKLFSNPEMLPDFNLRTIQAVQSIGGESNGYKDWFEALHAMEVQMDKEPYDIALIGCGAYGFPLAAYAKETGHQAVHLGGALQLLFGIRGARWEDPHYNNRYDYPSLMNEFWVKPGNDLKPKNAYKVENGCYW